MIHEVKEELCKVDRNGYRTTETRTTTTTNTFISDLVTGCLTLCLGITILGGITQVFFSPRSFHNSEVQR